MDEDKILKEIVSENLEKVYGWAIDKFEDEEQEMIQELATFHVYKIGQIALENAFTQLNWSQFSIKIEAKPRIPRSESIHSVKSEKEVENLIDKKIKILIPSLV